MVNAEAQYRRALKENLRCGKEVKTRLVEGFDKVLNTYLEEHANPSMDDLSAAFGPPEDMARSLMTEVTPQEHAQYRRDSLFAQILSFILAVVLVLSTFYIWFYKTNGLTAVDGADSSAEFTFPSFNSDTGGHIP